jgi:hypothetical protein
MGSLKAANPNPADPDATASGRKIARHSLLRRKISYVNFRLGQR